MSLRIDELSSCTAQMSTVSGVEQVENVENVGIAQDKRLRKLEKIVALGKIALIDAENAVAALQREEGNVAKSMLPVFINNVEKIKTVLDIQLARLVDAKARIALDQQSRKF